LSFAARDGCRRRLTILGSCAFEYLEISSSNHRSAHREKRRYDLCEDQPETPIYGNPSEHYSDFKETPLKASKQFLFSISLFLTINHIRSFIAYLSPGSDFNILACNTPPSPMMDTSTGNELHLYLDNIAIYLLITGSLIFILYLYRFCFIIRRFLFIYIAFAYFRYIRTPCHGQHEMQHGSWVYWRYQRIF
jgi:hypothetical protein